MCVCVCVFVYLFELFLGLVSAGVLGRWRGSFSAPFRWVILSWITSLMFLIHSCLASMLDAWRRNDRITTRPAGHRKCFRVRFRLTLSTVLLSEEGVLPAHRANLHESPSMCSVTPNSEVCRKKKLWDKRGEKDEKVTDVTLDWMETHLPHLWNHKRIQADTHSPVVCSCTGTWFFQSSLLSPCWKPARAQRGRGVGRAPFWSANADPKPGSCPAGSARPAPPGSPRNLQEEEEQDMTSFKV